MEVPNRPGKGRSANVTTNHAIASDLRKKLLNDSLGSSIEQRFRLYQITSVLVIIANSSSMMLSYTGRA